MSQLQLSNDGAPTSRAFGLDQVRVRLVTNGRTTERLTSYLPGGGDKTVAQGSPRRSEALGTEDTAPKRTRLFQCGHKLSRVECAGCLKARRQRQSQGCRRNNAEKRYGVGVYRIKSPTAVRGDRGLSLALEPGGLSSVEICSDDMASKLGGSGFGMVPGNSLRPSTVDGRRTERASQSEIGVVLEGRRWRKSCRSGAAGAQELR